MVYDGLKKPIQIIRPDGTVESWEQVQSSLERTAKERDPLLPEGAITTYTYDAKGNMAPYVDSETSKTENPDSDGRLEVGETGTEEQTYTSRLPIQGDCSGYRSR